MEDGIYKSQELLRARYIIEKAERAGENVLASLREHMVGQSFIKELLGETAIYVPKVKRKKSNDTLKEWAKENVGKEFNSQQIAEITKISYTTVTKFISQHRDLFAKVSRGTYKVQEGRPNEVR